jgi:glycosyltransferase involved in cell wall biosynthesis
VNVVFDLRGFQSREHGERGIARYVLHLALALERQRPGLVTQYLMHPELPFPAGAEALVATGRVVRSDQRPAQRCPSESGVFVAASPFEDFNVASDVVIPPWVRSPSWRTIAVLYDLIPGLMPDLYFKTPVDRLNYQARLCALGSLDWLLAISQTSADDVVELIGFDRRRITVIGAGADRRFRSPAQSPGAVAGELIDRGLVPGLRPGYVFFPTGLDPRKNIERTVEAYGRLPAEVRERHQLVVTCRLGEHGRHYLTDLASRAGVTDTFLVTGYVSDELLCRLYQGAHLVVFPSLYEGFGLPVLEAMTCGAPVIVADSSSLPEVQTIAEARFDPASVSAIAGAMTRALGDGELLRRLRMQELPPFSWDRAANLTGGVIDDLLGRLRARAGTGPASRARRRNRLALVGPMSPQRGETATYVHRLAAELQYQCDLSIFVGSGIEDIDAPEGAVVELISHFEPISRGGGAFDRVLYVLGSGASSVPVLEALRLAPGWVLLHDVRLSELYGHLHRIDPERLTGGTVGATLAALYPGRYRPAVEQMATIAPDVADRFGILLTREVTTRAERVLVHSRYEASLVGLDSGVDPIVAFGLPCPDLDGVDFSEVGGRRPIVSSFGELPPPAQLENLVAGMAVVRRQVPEARLRFVGPPAGGQGSHLAELARQAGVAGAVELIDPVDEEGHVAARVETTVAVQLQAPGAATAATVAELLAFGVPTVVADVGPMTELADDVVVKVDLNSTPTDLGHVIAALLGDDDHRSARSQAAKDHAKASSFAHAAETLIGVIFT